jgi:hypothetical protein
MIEPGESMLYIVIERFRGGDAVPVYRRFRDQGRLMPEGLRYVSSWVTADLRRCFGQPNSRQRAGLLRL